MVVFETKYNQIDFANKGIQALTKTLESDLVAIIVDSYFTKSEVLKYFPHLSAKIHVTHLGCDSREAKPEVNTGGPFLDKEFIFYLGTLEKRKNVIGVIRAFELLCQRGREEDLVLAGGWGFGSDELKLAIESSLYKHRIHCLDFVSDAEVWQLFGAAKCFVFPSFYEGFGLPVLEAMKLGCPVVTSKGGALLKRLLKGLPFWLPLKSLRRLRRPFWKCLRNRI